MPDTRESWPSPSTRPTKRAREASRGSRSRPRETLDLVVLAAEWGSGRRRGWLSNLHLGARDPSTGDFVMLGKTFKGMTDEILAWQTQKLQEIATEKGDWVVRVRPELVVEIAFNDIQKSPHYPGGLALRFARLKAYREDKRPDEADTIETVRAIYRRRTGNSLEVTEKQLELWQGEHEKKTPGHSLRSRRSPHRKLRRLVPPPQPNGAGARLSRRSRRTSTARAGARALSPTAIGSSRDTLWKRSNASIRSTTSSTSTIWRSRRGAGRLSPPARGGHRDGGRDQHAEVARDFDRRAGRGDARRRGGRWRRSARKARSRSCCFSLPAS